MADIHEIRARAQKYAPFIIGGLVVVMVAWVLIQAKLDGNQLQASGTIEVVQINLAAQVGGPVSAVLVESGDAVEAGQILIVLDKAQAQANYDQAAAGLAQAKANYEVLRVGGSAEQHAAAIAAAQAEVVAAQQALDAVYDNAALVRAQVLTSIAQAEITVEDAERMLNNLQSSSEESDINAAQAAVVLTRDKYEKAQEDYSSYENKPEDNLTRAALLAQLAQTEQLFNDAVRRLNNLQGTADAADVDLASAQLAQAQAQLQISLDKLEEMADGPDPDALALAEARLANAEARLALAETGAGPEQLSQAQAGIDAAQAVLDLAAIQLERTEVKAPVAGTILFSNVEIGEIVIPSAILMTLGQLDELTLTVYLPEDRYGSVQLGDVVEVTVDSFPDERFEATVVRIADEAEFTPRNVQTQEGRRTTVFGIELRVTNAQNRLKPGMPADVDFTP